MYLGFLGAASQEASTTSLPITPLRSAQVGQTVILVCGSAATAANDVNFAATDTKGNTWVHVNHGYKSGTSQISVLVCQVTTEFSPTDTITITHGGTGSTVWSLAAYLFDDVVSVDVSANVNATASTALAVGPTAAAAQNSQLVFAAFVYSGSGVIFNGAVGWASDERDVGVTTFRSTAATWQYANASGTRSAAGTLSSSSIYAGVIVALNAPVQPQIARPTATTTGGTVTPGGMASHTAMADDDATSYTDSIASPSASPKQWTLGALVQPSDLSSLKIYVEESRIASTSGSFVVKLYEGATLRSTSSAITITSAQPRYYVYNVPTIDATAITTSGWGNLSVKIEETAA